jgi:hypothetical protein
MTPLLLAMLSGENTPNFLQGTGINTLPDMIRALLSGNFMGQFGSQQQPQFNAGARPHQFPEARFTEVKHV